MPTYSFRCCTTFDRRVGFDVSMTECPTCGKDAQRESVYRVNSIGWARTPGTERDYSMEWKNSQEAGAELEYQVERLRDATQIPDLQPPPLYKMAKAKALDLAAKGATADDL